MGGKRRNVVATLAQRGNENRQDVQSIVQIFAKLTYLDECRQVLVSGGNHANVHVVRPVTAHGSKVPRLEPPQKLRLQVDRQLADLVEQQRAAVCLREQAVARLHGSRECPARMPKELRLEQVFRNGSNVHRDEGAVTTSAASVDRTRDELFADPGFAGHEHGGARSRDKVDGSLQRRHRRPAANEMRVRDACA
jgi:hypothetical protein